MQVITSHTNADFDTLASMMAAKRLYPAARLVWAGSLERALGTALESLELPHRVERVTDIELDAVDMLILVDVRHASRIGPFAGIIGRKGLDIHIYDHHPEIPDAIHGSLEVIEPYGSTTTLLTMLLKERGIELAPVEATVMMAGIYEDTGHLSYRSTTVADYEASAFLLSFGADLSRVSELLKHELSPDEVALLNSLLQSRVVYTVGGVEVSVVEGSLDEYSGEIASLAEKIAQMGGVRNLFMVVDSGDRVHVVARSSESSVDVGAVLRELGGGGHAGAASATIKGVTVIEARERLLALLKERLVPARRAEEIMSYPPISTGPDTTLSAVMLTMRRYNVNAMPVVDEGKIAGVVTRQVVDKAIYHGLGSAEVGEYMTTECDTVDVATTVDEIRKRTVSHGARLLPVEQEGKLVGVITRTDLLKLLQEELSVTPVGRGAGKIRRVEGLLGEKLPEWLFEVLKEAGVVAERMGFKLYLVGGVVRDLLLRRENLDIDIVVEGGDGIEFANEFASEYARGHEGEKGLHVRAHSRFKTAVVIFPDGFKIDVATARLEYYDKPGSLPTIEQSSLKLDLYRRDFIINTLAISLNPPVFGRLIDFFGAQRDLKDGRIRVLHNLSFVEDPTRVIRAVRFSEKFGFKIDKHTVKLIKSAARSGLIGNVSGIRLFDELKHLFAEEAPVRALSRLQELGVLGFIHPSIAWDAPLEALFERARDSLAWYRLLYRDEGIEEWLVYLLALSVSLSESELSALAEELNIAGRRRLEVLGRRDAAKRALGRIETGTVGTGSALWALCRPFPTETLLYMMACTESDEAREALSHFITRLGDETTLLKGTDLLEMGVAEGPEVGQVLASILSERLDGKIETLQEEREFVLEKVHKK
ncbi:MAG: CBS domain-containing protein [Proteobacteria bacterium]|nr:CBS domain-containing protein [Pseudomonadota bacterium]